jgi:Ran GTPase-activating protein (RanGAP) involved in mRNA processing and transport
MKNSQSVIFLFLLSVFILSSTSCFSEEDEGYAKNPDHTILASSSSTIERPNILDFPDEILVTIGSHMDDCVTFNNVSLTNKAFQTIIGPEIFKQYLKQPFFIDLSTPNSLDVFDNITKQASQMDLPLNLRIDNVTSRDILHRIFSNCSNLKALDLSKNNLTGNKIEILLNSLKTLQSLQVLNLSTCQLDLDDMEKLTFDEGIPSTKEVTPMFPKLTSLILTGNSFGNEGVTLLAKNHHHFPALKVLDISKTALGSKGMYQLLSSPLGKSLTTLRAKHNYISEEGIPADITETDLENLNELDLTNNSFNADRVPITVGSLKDFSRLIHRAWK